MTKLSIIIPAYNEEATIAEIIRRVNSAKVGKLSKEIIVVDDGSSDKTVEIVLHLQKVKLLTHRKNQGKGASIKTGLKSATGDIFLIQDADLEYSPEDYPKLLKPILEGKSQVVYGTRFNHLDLVLFGKKQTPFISHYLGNKFLNLVTNILYRSKLTDMETGYKVITHDVYRKLNLTASRFDFEPQITAQILKAHFKISEVPISFSPRTYAEGKKITWRDGLAALKTLIKERFTF